MTIFFPNAKNMVKNLFYFIYWYKIYIVRLFIFILKYLLMNNSETLEQEKSSRGLFWAINSLWYRIWNKEIKDKDLGINDIRKVFYMNGYRNTEINFIIKNHRNIFIKRLYFRERNSEDIGNLYNEKWVAVKEALEYMRVKKEFLELFSSKWDYLDNLWKEIWKTLPKADKIRRKWFEILDWLKLTNRRTNKKSRRGERSNNQVNSSINTFYISNFLQIIDLEDVFALVQGILKIRELKKNSTKQKIEIIIE